MIDVDTIIVSQKFMPELLNQIKKVLYLTFLDAANHYWSQSVLKSQLKFKNVIIFKESSKRIFYAKQLKCLKQQLWSV